MRFLKPAGCILAVLAALFARPLTPSAIAQQSGPVFCGQQATATGLLSTTLGPDDGNGGVALCGWTMSAAANSAITVAGCLNNNTILTVQVAAGTTASDDSPVQRGLGVAPGDAVCVTASTAANITLFYGFTFGPSNVFLSGAPVDCNFLTNVNRGNCALTVTRAGANATNLLPTSPSGAAFVTYAANTPRLVIGSGLLVEETRVNQLLNSTAPATQTTGSLANATYTLWVNGSGSATMSTGTATGCGTSVATQGNPISFTTSGAAGTCTVTVAGALNAFQLEAGAFGTSLIVTAGATGTRASEQIVLASPPTLGTAYSLFAQGTPLSPAANTNNQILAELDDGTATNRLMINRVATTAAYQGTNTTASTGTNLGSGTMTTGARAKVALTTVAGRQSTSFNGGTVATGAGGLPVSLTAVRIGTNAAATLQWDGWVERVTVWPRATLSDAMLVSLTR